MIHDVCLFIKRTNPSRIAVSCLGVPLQQRWFNQPLNVGADRLRSPTDTVLFVGWYLIVEILEILDTKFDLICCTLSLEDGAPCKIL